MNDVYITSFQLNNSISKLPYDKVDNIEIYEKEVQVRHLNKLCDFINSFQTFTTISFIKISRLPIWYYLGKSFDIYTKDDSSLEFFKKIILLTLGKDVGLLVKGDLEDYKFVDKANQVEINKDEFYLLIHVVREVDEFKIKAIPLQLSDYFVMKFLQNCKLQDQSTLTNATFVESVNNNDKNDILNKFAERKAYPLKSFSSLDGTFGSQVLTHASKQKNVNPVKDTTNNNITDYEFFKKNIMNFINSELRMRNISSNSKDYQLLINNVFKSTMFAFRHELQDKSRLNIKIDNIRDVVIKLMDIFI